MTKCVGHCGLDCTKCPAYLALKNNDDELRIKTAEEWTKKYHHQFSKDMINCTGCTSKKGPQCGYCSLCAVRKCAQKRNTGRCINCSDFDSCKIVKEFEKQSGLKLK